MSQWRWPKVMPQSSSSPFNESAFSQWPLSFRLVATASMQGVFAAATARSHLSVVVDANAGGQTSLTTSRSRVRVVGVVSLK